MPRTIHIQLAEDDIDDIMLFREALGEFNFPTELAISRNGEQLMRLLDKMKEEVPDILFLDLNMPRINGLYCLEEIRKRKKLSCFPVVVFTTSSDLQLINQAYQAGADYFIQKPNNFNDLKQAIYKALKLIETATTSQPPREEFIIFTHFPVNGN